MVWIFIEQDNLVTPRITIWESLHSEAAQLFPALFDALVRSFCHALLKFCNKASVNGSVRMLSR